MQAMCVLHCPAKAGTYLDLEEVGRDVVGSGVHLSNQHLVIARKRLAHLQRLASMKQNTNKGAGADMKGKLASVSCSSVQATTLSYLLLTLERAPVAAPTPLAHANHVTQRSHQCGNTRN